MAAQQTYKAEYNYKYKSKIVTCKSKNEKKIYEAFIKWQKETMQKKPRKIIITIFR